MRPLSRTDLSPCTSRPGRSPIGLTSTRVTFSPSDSSTRAISSAIPPPKQIPPRAYGPCGCSGPELSDEHLDDDVYRHVLRPEVVVELERVEGVVALEASPESTETHGAPVVRWHEVERRSRVARVDGHRLSARGPSALEQLCELLDGRGGEDGRGGQVMVTAKLRDLGE